MSFEANDMNTIHRGNYEEFFILYMDNELNEEKVKMVEDFLAAHPDLKVELDVLMSAKLPVEELHFDKKDLLAESMKLSSVDEELLLYMDNELPADKRKIVEIELTSNENYRLQHQILVQTKLNPAEIITYPNKKELYRRTEKVVVFKLWMRVAAAVVVIAVSGILYFRNTSPSPATGDIQTTAGTTKPAEQKNSSKEQLIPETIQPGSIIRDEIAVTKPGQKEVKRLPVVDKEEKQKENPVQQDVIAYTPEKVQEEIIDRSIVKNIETNKEEKGITETITSVNTSNVTSSLANRIDNSSGNDEKLFASNNNDRKGSVKGFLRKATRMIEKRIGIDPTNEDGELLIAAVAINLK